METVPEFRNVLRSPLVCLLTSGFLLTEPVQATDADGDGIPASWEDFRGTRDSDPSDALVDFDGDGLNTYLEYLTQGRPWGNYVLHRFPWTALPPSIPASGLTGAEFLTANQSGEYLVNCYDAAGTHTFLWTPVPGAPLATAALTAIPVPLTMDAYDGPPLINDYGQLFLPNSLVPATGEIRSLRNWNLSPVTIGGTPPPGAEAAALANNGRILVGWNAAGSNNEVLQNWQFTDGTAGSGILTVAHTSSSSFSGGLAFDPASGMWLLGAHNHFPGLEPAAWHLPPDGQPLSLIGQGPLPGSSVTGGFIAAAGGMAVGMTDMFSLTTTTLVFDGSAWQSITGGVAETTNWPIGVSDEGLVLAETTTPPSLQFLWRGIAVETSKARLEISGSGISLTGLTGAGALYGIDFGNGASVPEPVVFRPVAHLAGDGAAEESIGSQPDGDIDGIPDINESAAGTNAALADSDGDGWADLFELVFRRSPVIAEIPPPHPEVGPALEVYTPAGHPLALTTLATP